MDYRKIMSNAGKPRIWGDIEEMRSAISDYFEDCLPQPLINKNTDEPYMDKKGKVIMVEGDKLTITGLALSLGYADRQSIYDGIKRKDEYSCLIKNAMTIVENGYEKLVQGSTPTGAIFVLKNMKWRDKTEVEASGDNTLTIRREVIKSKDTGDK
jgi:hypothetical protein